MKNREKHNLSGWNVDSSTSNQIMYHPVFVIACIVFLFCNAMAQSIPEDEMRIDATIRDAIIDTVTVKLTELYVFPDVAGRMVDYIRGEQTKGAYKNIRTLGEFVNRLTEDLLSVYPDGHLEIDVLRETQRDKHVSDDDDTWWTRRVEEAQYNNCYFRKIEWFPGNIGYLDLRRFEYPDISGPVLTAAMTFFAHSDALIIDLRHNPGGRGELTQIIFSYFFEDHRVHFLTSEDRMRGLTKQWWTIPYVPGERLPDVPIYILTSENTGSAAEEFAYSLKHLGRAVVVGDTTAGAAHTTHRHMFPDLHIEMHIPDGTNISPVTGKDWEGVGVIPNIAVPPERALDIAYTEALGVLLDKETDELRRFRLDWAKKELDARLNPLNIEKEKMKQYIGVYGPRKIFLEEGVLYYQRVERPKFRLIPLGGDLFMLDGLDYFRIQFERDDGGRVVRLVGIYDDGSRSTSQRSSE